MPASSFSVPKQPNGMWMNRRLRSSSPDTLFQSDAVRLSHSLRAFATSTLNSCRSEFVLLSLIHAANGPTSDLKRTTARFAVR